MMEIRQPKPACIGRDDSSQPQFAMSRRLAPYLIALALSGATIPALAAETASAHMKNSDGGDAGTAQLMGTPHGVLIHVRLQGLPPGVHAFHIHSVGRCEPPFTSAGGHFNPEQREHGLVNPRGPHAGDLPNITVPASGSLEFEVFASRVSLADGAANGLIDADGSSLVVHAGPDDYRSDPAGHAGDRIVCGVIVR
jgi:Cu-Zn family superoxide dismutase